MPAEGSISNRFRPAISHRKASAVRASVPLYRLCTRVTLICRRRENSPASLTHGRAATSAMRYRLAADRPRRAVSVEHCSIRSLIYIR
jgi:hypothetical protein